MIRAATLEDTPRIAELAGQLGYPCTEAEMHPRLAALLANTDHDAVLVTDDLTGWIHVALVQSLESAPFAEIRGLVVDEAHRGRGIGQTLVAAAEDWARSRDVNRIRVRSNVKRERTHPFYERLGYATTKSQKVFDKRL
ncbi:MAG: GNAT family N-acetyltransferase [Acidobacteriota bacterium]|nr:GNAT family N-acetyltransferase [Acidobacteriota bacterium]